MMIPKRRLLMLIFACLHSLNVAGIFVMPTQDLQNSVLQPLNNKLDASTLAVFVVFKSAFRLEIFNQLSFEHSEFEAKENKNRAGFREKLELNFLHTLHAT